MERVRTALEVMPDPALACDGAGSILDMNDEACALLGYRREELAGLPIETLVPAGLVAAHREHRSTFWERPRRRRMGTGLEIRALRKDGSEIVVDIALSPITTDHGVVVIAAMRDISERQRAEIRIRDSERRLAEAQRVARVGSWEWDVDGNRVTWSNELYRIYGLDERTFEATYEGYLSRVHPEDRATSAAAIEHALESGADFSFEERIVRPDGEIRWLATWGKVETAPDGTPGRLTGICQDISDRKQADEIKDAFLAATSHELRTPLTGVLAAARTLANASARLGEAERAELLELLERQATKLDRLLADLLDIDRLTRGVVTPHRRPTEIAELVRQITQSAEPDGHILHVDSDTLIADVDAPKLERIIENLLSNAYRHTPAGSNVWLRAEEHADGVLLTVEDDGPGVPDHLKKLVFEPFQRGETPEYRPGTGIGLSLVSRFAALHGGHAWVADRPGGGASFRVHLPADVEGGTGTSTPSRVPGQHAP
ncbi:MAG TPA: PAS domain S-box protein [Actinomycetota bacterium]